MRSDALAIEAKGLADGLSFIDRLSSSAHSGPDRRIGSPERVIRAATVPESVRHKPLA